MSTITNFEAEHASIEALSTTPSSSLALYRNTISSALVIYKTYRTGDARQARSAQAVLSQLRAHQQVQDHEFIRTSRVAHGAYQHSQPHPHIQATLDIAFAPVPGDETRTNITVLTPFYQGGDLRQFYTRFSAASTPIPEPFLLKAFAQLASALEFLHTGANQKLDRCSIWPSCFTRRTKPTITRTSDKTWAPILHCDIKAANIALAPASTPLGNSPYAYPDSILIDFDISLLAGYKPQDAISCTHRYAAPEYPVASTASDIWSLGATFHFLCTGRAVRELPRVGLSRTGSFGEKVGEERIVEIEADGSRSERALTVEDYVVRRRRFADVRVWTPWGCGGGRRKRGYSRKLEGLVWACLELRPERRCCALQLRGRVEKAWGWGMKKAGPTREEIDAGLWAIKEVRDWEGRAGANGDGWDDSEVAAWGSTGSTLIAKRAHCAT